MLPDPKVRCPYTGFTKSCHQIVTKYQCPKFVSLKGTNPQTGEAIDKYGCADGFMPILAIEGAQMTRQVSAELGAFRNELAIAAQSIGAARQQALK